MIPLAVVERAPSKLLLPAHLANRHACALVLHGAGSRACAIPASTQGFSASTQVFLFVAAILGSLQRSRISLQRFQGSPQQKTKSLRRFPGSPQRFPPAPRRISGRRRFLRRRRRFFRPRRRSLRRPERRNDILLHGACCPLLPGAGRASAPGCPVRVCAWRRDSTRSTRVRW